MVNTRERKSTDMLSRSVPFLVVLTVVLLSQVVVGELNYISAKSGMDEQ